MKTAADYERASLTIAFVVLLAFLAAVGYSVLGLGIQLPGHEASIDPRVVAQTPPFDRAGLHQVGDGQYEVAMVAQVWSFNPNEIRVPVGSAVTFYVTSKDVIHGLKILNTDVNVMVVPGQLTKVTARFARPGEYVFFCHEYCGVGHQAMFGKVIVE